MRFRVVLATNKWVWLPPVLLRLCTPARQASLPVVGPSAVVDQNGVVAPPVARLVVPSRAAAVPRGGDGGSRPRSHDGDGMGVRERSERGFSGL